MKGLSPRCLLLLAFVTTSTLADTDTSLREQGVLYFEGNVADKLTVTPNVSTTVYLHRDFQMVLAAFAPGQAVELVGMSPEGFLVKGSYRNNTIVGWIHPEDLPTGIDPSIFEAAKKRQVERDAIAAAINNRAVIRGMSPDDVKASVGRPEQISSKTDESGSIITWVYTTYRDVPQSSYGPDAFGRIVLQTYLVKVATGQLIVSFVNNAVTGVEEHKTDPNSSGVPE